MRLVHRPYFSRLGNGDDAGLHVVLVADAVVGVADSFDRELAILGWKWNQLATGEFFRRSAFVGINVGSFGADHRVVRIGQRFQAEAVGGGAVEYDEDVNIGAKVLPEFANRGFRVGIVAVSHSVALIGR